MIHSSLVCNLELHGTLFQYFTNFTVRRPLYQQLRILLLTILLGIGGLPPAAHAAVTLEDKDYDLVSEYGLVHYSQTDYRWGTFTVGPEQKELIGQCGCLLAVLATVLNNQVTGMSPWFATEFFGGGSAFDFNPRYLDLFFNKGPTGRWTSGWGYKQSIGGCGVIPHSMALQLVGNFMDYPVGIDVEFVRGFGQNVKDVINRNLLAGRATIALIRTESLFGPDHAALIAGWDKDQGESGAYRFLDPRTPRFGMYGPNLPQVKMLPPNPDGSGEPTIQNYLTRIVGILDIKPSSGGPLPSFIFGDDPSPIEILMTGPDGRRTGFETESGAYFEENTGASYWAFGLWRDPLGEVAAGTSPRFVQFTNAPSGLYHFKVTGMADGPLQLSAESIFGGTRVLLGDFSGTIAAGEIRKYELEFSRTGTSTVAQVTNFTPHATAGDDLSARTDAPVHFDGRRSFDADGAIVSYAWDFGDGATGLGEATQHVYSTPGDYTVTLTVTDADGATATDTLQVQVILSQQRPVADVSGPYLGFAATTEDWAVFLDARRSSDPNNDPLSYHWDFGDGSPSVITSTPYTEHVYVNEGAYTLTLVVNDGIDDSLPATTRVEVGPAPANRLSWSGEAVLTPDCGIPGQVVTIRMGSYGQFRSWNYGTEGALPPFPPSHLMLGLSAPDGLMRLGLPGGERVDVPFQATLLSPGRFNASASFTVPELEPGNYQVMWAEDTTLPFQVPCPRPANYPPVADAGGPYTGGTGTPIVFDGSASSDPDGDALTYAWDFGDGAMAEGVNPTHSYAQEGRYLVTLIVSDGQASSLSSTDGRSYTLVTVETVAQDIIPPTTTAETQPPANAAGWHTSPVSVQLHAVDNPGGSGVRDITYELTGAQTGLTTVAGDSVQLLITNEGTTEIRFFARDNAGNSEVPQSLLIRLDRTGPIIKGMPAVGCQLWPPNHKLVKVAKVQAMDVTAGLATAGLHLTANSNEPEDGLGDGDTSPDVVIEGNSVALRAERSGTGVGRIYTITATAVDLAGNKTVQESVCTVPHDQGGKP